MAERVQFEVEETGSVPPEQQEQQQPERPDWLPQEFDSVEAFVKSAQDTKAAYTKSQQELAELKKQEFQEEQEEDPEGDPAQQAAQAANFDLAPYQEEYLANGDVSPESRDKIAEGLKSVLGENARQVVDQYIDGQKNTHSNDMRLYMETAGGEESYQAMVEWAAQAMTPEQQEAYNKQVNSGDRSTVLFAIESLKTRYEAANGRAPSSLLSGRAPAVSGVKPFASSSQMIAAMQDPKYKSDPAYREEVSRRIAASNFEG